MKPIIITIVLISLSVCAKSQIKVDGHDISQYTYVKIIGNRLNSSKQTKVIIDYGQVKKLYKEKQTLTDLNGKSIEFKSVVQALNYLAKYNWILDKETTLYGDYGTLFHYILKKK